MKKQLAVVCLASTLMAGCALQPPQPTGFYWGNYSRTLYEYEKNPGTTSREAHQNTLKEIISSADAGNGKVPPGVYAELGNLYLDQGDKAQAVKYFELEAAHYPESAVLMKNLINKAGKA